MPLESGAFLSAILLGDRSELPKHLQTAFKNSGVYHILAISGLHVGIIALIIIYLLRLLRAGRGFSYIVTILFLISFALLTLSRPSVLRAVVMACVFLIGMLLGRKVDVYNSLGIAGLFILIRNPKDLFNVGFQLSFLAVFFIVYLVPRFMKTLRQDTNPRIRKYIYMPLAVSISAWLGTAPLILYYFRIITPIAIIANSFIIPLLFILLIGALAFLLFGWMSFLGSFLAGFNDICVHIIFSLADFFSSLRFGHFHLG
jgi:competence protein ComEC